MLKIFIFLSSFISPNTYSHSTLGDASKNTMISSISHEATICNSVCTNIPEASFFQSTLVPIIHDIYHSSVSQCSSDREIFLNLSPSQINFSAIFLKIWEKHIPPFYNKSGKGSQKSFPEIISFSSAGYFRS